MITFILISCVNSLPPANEESNSISPLKHNEKPPISEKLQPPANAKTLDLLESASQTSGVDEPAQYAAKNLIDNRKVSNDLDGTVTESDPLSQNSLEIHDQTSSIPLFMLSGKSSALESSSPTSNSAGIASFDGYDLESKDSQGVAYVQQTVFPSTPFSSAKDVDDTNEVSPFDSPVIYSPPQRLVVSESGDEASGIPLPTSSGESPVLASSSPTSNSAGIASFDGYDLESKDSQGVAYIQQTVFPSTPFFSAKDVDDTNEVSPFDSPVIYPLPQRLVVSESGDEASIIPFSAPSGEPQVLASSSPSLHKAGLVNFDGNDLEPSDFSTMGHIQQTLFANNQIPLAKDIHDSDGASPNNVLVVSSFQERQVIAESLVGIESVQPYSVHNEISKLAMDGPESLPLTEDNASVVEDFSSIQNENTLPVLYSSVSKPTGDIASDPLSFIIILIIFVTLFLIVRWKKRKTLKLKLQLSHQASYQTRVRPMPQAVTTTQVSALKSHSLPMDPTNENENMYSVHIEDDGQPVREYQIPRISQDNANVSGFIHWIPPGKRIEFNGHCIDGGMFYIGSKVRGASDPSYINTRKPLTNFIDYHADLMGYWPNYSEISADARGAYLAWLAQGRDDQGADPGYVFLFFYGLERRILIDFPEGKVSTGEIDQIRCEVVRLLSIYGKQSASVRGYFSRFLNLLLVLGLGDKKLYNEPIPTVYEGGEIPIYLKVLLGQCAKDGIPMPQEAAYFWVLYDSLITKRTPVKRCGDEFKELFMLRYAIHFGQGIRLPQNKTMLQASYSSASANLYDIPLNLHILHDLPDVTRLSSIRQKLQDLVDECSSDLDRHSRYIGKTVDEEDQKRSLVLLPAELVASIKKKYLGEFQQLLLDKGSIVMQVSDALQNILGEEKPTKDSLQVLAKTLEIKNIGMEPDVLAYPYDLSITDPILLFPLPGSIPKDRTDGNYLLNVLVVELSEAIARADGTVDEKEREAIQQHLNTLRGVSDYHIMRLHKHLEFLQHSSLQESSIKKKLKTIPSTDVAKLLASVNHVVLADGVIDSSEIQFLERIYKYLNIDSSELYHNIQNPNARSRVNGSNTDISIDFDRVNALKIESAEIASILSEIFSGEEPSEITVSVVPAEENNDNHNPLGLDDFQTRFLTALLSKPLWTRKELQSIADQHRIMLDGTLELINESALDQFGILVTDGDDSIEILEEFRGKTTWE